jgi:hypothetical protein
VDRGKAADTLVVAFGGPFILFYFYFYFWIQVANWLLRSRTIL